MSTTGRRRAGLALVAVIAVSVGGIAVHASYTTSVEVLTEVSAGHLDINVDGDDGDRPYELELPADLNPGIAVTRDFELRNTGTVDAAVSMVTGEAQGPLTRALHMRLHAGGREVASGPVDGIEHTGLRLDAGQSVTVTVELAAPGELGNDFQGLSEPVLLNIAASQANATTTEG